MIHRSLRGVALIAIVALALPAGALAQTGFGVRAGSFTPSGDHLEMEAATAFGAHLALGFIPVLKFQIGLEYLSGTADYDYGVAGTLADQDFRNLAIFADVRYPITLMPMFPIKPIIGGGLNANLMTYLDEDTFAAGPNPSPEDLTRMGYHLMAGLMFKAPVLPFTVTAEYRMHYIPVTDGTVSSNGVLLGLTFGF